VLQVVKLIHVASLIIWLGTLFVLIQLITRDLKFINRGDLQRLCRKIYLGIDLPVFILAITTGIILFFCKEANTKAGWFHMKMTGMLLLVFCDIWTARLISVFKKRPLRKNRALQGVYVVSLLLTLSAIYFVRNKEAEWHEKYTKELVQK
jgi:uncharacterized membrane protein